MLIAVLVVLQAMVPGLTGEPALATEGDVGVRGPSTSGISGSAPTASRPESKLWWNDGSWWANLFDTVSGDNHIFRMDLATQTWINTGVRVDERNISRADTLWDGTHLYVASHVYTTSASPATAAEQGRVYRFSYDRAARSYALDAGFPVAINQYKTETLVLDKDSTGKLWATWTQNGEVWVNRTVGGDAAWGAPFRLPVSGATGLNSDDISSLTTFGGDKIGVMWSNQVTSAMYFAVHADSQPDTTWEQSRTAIQGPSNVDDHISLKSLQSDGSGRVFAAVKTDQTVSSAPLVMLLVRDPASGDWASHVFGRKTDHHTRPIVVLDETNAMLHMFATAGEAGGTIYRKSTPINAISFPSGLGEPFIRDAASADMNDATTSKHNVNATTGLLVLASDDTTDYYWHKYEPIPGEPAQQALAAGFSVSPASGQAPLPVQFTDTSTGTPTAWSWAFGDGTTSAVQNPGHTYAQAGTYDVTLTVTDAAGATDTRTVPAAVTATTARTTFSPVADAYVNPNKATRNYGGSDILRVGGSGANGYTSYLTFNLPPMTAVTDARLRIWVSGASANGGTVHMVTDVWTESTITSRNAPPLGAQVASVGPVAVGRWVEVPLPPGTFAQSGGTYSFGIMSTSADDASYSSREGTNPSQLVLTG